MVKPAVLLLAAGYGRRFGGLKQLAPVGPQGQALLDYSIFDALRLGASRIVVVGRIAILDELREHLLKTFGPTHTITIVAQDGQNLGRPLRGTTEAIIVGALECPDRPLVVMNGDDFYGRQNLESLFSSLSEVGAESTHDASKIESGEIGASEIDVSLIGYPVEQTLSDHGGVSRARCLADPDGTVNHIQELSSVRSDEGKLTGRDESGLSVEIVSGTPVSMNLWGLSTGITPLLRELLREFRKGIGSADVGELGIGTAIHRLLKTGRIRVKMSPATDRWFGITFAEDCVSTADELARLTKSGDYPDDRRMQP